MPVRAHGPEPCASTNSATRALRLCKPIETQGANANHPQRGVPHARGCRHLRGYWRLSCTNCPHKNGPDVVTGRFVLSGSIGCMKAIMTVTGVDHTGIVAAVASAVAKRQANILNVSQTLMDGYFTMIMHLEFDNNEVPITQLQADMNEVAQQQKLQIRLQAAQLFDEMHRL